MLPPDPSSSELGAHVIVITEMRATGVTTSPGRIPAGFYASISMGNQEYRTQKKSVAFDSDTIEWTDHFALPPDPLATIHLRIYASFELGPMLGRGELLSRFSISVRNLINRSNDTRLIVFPANDDEIAVACPSLDVNVCALSPADLSSVVWLSRVAAGTHLERDMNLLTDAGHRHMLRYYRDPQEYHLDKAITRYEKVLDRCPEDHSCRGAALSNLAFTKLISCLAEGAYLDLDVPISLYRQVLDLRPNGHPDRPFTLINLAKALLSRFHKRGQNEDADEAGVLLMSVLDTHPADSCEHQSALLVMQTFVTDNRTDDMAGSNDASEGSSASESYSSPSSLDRLALMLEECELRDDPQLLDRVIAGHRDAEAHYKVGQQEWIVLQGNLAQALQMSFERRGQEQDLDEAIRRKQNLLGWTPPGHPDRSKSLNNLAAALMIRFDQQGNKDDIKEAVQNYRDSLSLRPLGHPHRLLSLNNLANALMTQFEQQGDNNDLDEALQHYHDALSQTPVGHPHRTGFLNNLATALMTRFDLRGDHRDLDEAIQHHSGALELIPTEHPDRSTHLVNLADALRTRFEQRGDCNDLDEALQHSRDALSLRPVGHPNRSASLNNLAATLMRRFDLQGDGVNLDEALQHYRDALFVTPTGSLHCSISLNNLAAALMTRFNQRGDDKDLDEAMQCYRDALALRSTGHPHRLVSLNNLAAALRTQFEHRGDGKDLDEALQHYHDALSLTPIGHLHRSVSLNNLAVALMRRFDQQGNSDDLDEALQYYHDVLSLRPTGHPYRSRSLNNLAAAIMTRYKSRGDENDLDQAIQHHRDALSLTSTESPDRLAILESLAGALTSRFEHRGSNNDIEEALRLCRTAETEIPSSHPARISICLRSAHIHLALWQTTRTAMHLSTAMAHYKAASDVEPAGLLARLQSCLACVHHGERHGHEAALEAYARSLQLLDAHISATPSVSARHAIMKHFPTSLAVDAASCALRQGDVPRALELLEHGRALLWNQLTRSRTPLDDLRSRDAYAESLVRRFHELSFQLLRQTTGEPKSSAGDLSKATMEAEANRYRRLVDEWNQAVVKIRSLDGFSRFLLPPLFSDLHEAAAEGPVIVLVASNFSCDAIIVLHNRPPIHIVLDITLERLVGLANQLLKQTLRLGDPQQMSPVKILQQLWDSVMLPVVSKLEELVERGSRIWWCPTSIFTAFPLHVVGEYRKTSKRSVAAYISSYTPSLSALIKARKTKLASSPVRFAAIGQALPGGHQVPLQSVDLEVDEIGRLLPSSSTVFTKLPSAESTKQRALHTLQNNPWVHFACHGTQDFNEPFKSHLAMLDGHLSLLDIIDSDLSKHEFAFLSACKTAVGDFETLDEVIHLAAGLQFMGVKSVIGTLWSVRDDVAYRLVTKFYERFCSGGKMDPSRAARALHQAVLSLARDKVPLEERMLFIHIGV